MAKDKFEKHETQFHLVPAVPPPAQPPVAPPPPAQAPEPQPDETWTTEALLAYVMTFLTEAIILARKTTVFVFRAGVPCHFCARDASRVVGGANSRSSMVYAAHLRLGGHRVVRAGNRARARRRRCVLDDLDRGEGILRD